MRREVITAAWLRAALACLIGLLVALAAGASALGANPPERQQVPIDFTISNPCNGETVVLSGYFTVQLQTFINENGHQHLRLHITEHVQGVGETTGARYIVNSEENIAYLVGSNDGYASTSEHRVEIIRLGEDGTHADDFFGREFLRATVNANGELTVFIDLQDLTCR